MANVDTVKAITANLEAILTGLGWQLEDLSADPKVETQTFARLDYAGEDFEDLFNERPSYITASFVVTAKVNRKYPGLSRAAAQDAVHALRGAITVSALNVGALSASKLVSFVRHDGAVVDYNPPISTITYNLAVRYREI